LFDPDTLAIGVLGKPHGVRGEIALRPFNTVGSIRALSPAAAEVVFLVRDGKTTHLRLRVCRPAGDHLLLAFDGVDSLEGARALVHSEVRVPRKALPPLAPGEYYVEDVVGCDVVNAAGQPLGQATGTFWNGAHDVMSVKSAEGELLIPMVPAVIVSVDVPARLVRVEWEVPADE
jgi:16S rRNA processing protein RimM